MSDKLKPSSVGRKTILVLAANPIGSARLALGQEVREIQESLRRSEYRDLFEVKQWWAVRPDELRRALLDLKPEIVHFCGHGTDGSNSTAEGFRRLSAVPETDDEGGIVLVDETGKAKLVKGKALTSLFAQFDCIECVVLNSCYSEAQAELIMQKVPVVIGMKRAIGDRAAIEFSKGFYDALGAGRSIEEAFQFGCNAIELQSIPEHLTPVIKHNRNLEATREQFLEQVYENLPRHATSRFFGRTQELEILHHELQNGQAPIVAIVGMPGVGKTELALKYAQENKQLYPAGVCWLHARGGNIAPQIIDFAQEHFQIETQHEDLLRQVRYCWRKWPPGKVLIILNDITNYRDIKPYLPLDSRFKILITTIVNLDDDGLYRLRLNTLDKDEMAAFDLLREWIGAEKLICDLPTRQDLTSRLCQRLGYLPLALQLVGHYINKRKSKMSLEEILRRLEERVLDHRSMQVELRDQTFVNIEQGVKDAFQLAWDDLADYPEAKRLGCLLSLLALAPIPWRLVQQIEDRQDDEELEDARVALEDLNLLTGEDPYQLHLLIREFFQEQLSQYQDEHALKQKICEVISTLAKQVPETPTQQDLLRIAPDIPHINEIATKLVDYLSDDDFIQPFQGLGRFYEGQGAYDFLEKWYEQCVEKAKQRFGEKHLSFASCLRSLATVYHDRGRYSEAEPRYRQVLSIRRDLLPEEHPDLADSLDDLALLLKGQDKFEDAESLYLESLNMRRNLFDRENFDVADSLNNLGVLYDRQGKYEEAETFLVQALEMRQRLFSDTNQPRIVTSLNNLASCYHSQGYSAQDEGNFTLAQERFTLAEELYLRALELSKQLFGENRWDIATALSNLAQVYSDQNNFTQALPLLRNALEIQNNILGEKHDDIAYTLNNLAACFQGLELFEQAENYYKQALEMRQEVLSENHSNIGISLNNLAKLYSFQERLEEALPLQEEAARIMEVSLGLEHRHTEKIFSNLKELQKRINSKKSR